MDKPLKDTVYRFTQQEYDDLPNKRGDVSNKIIGLHEQKHIEYIRIYWWFLSTKMEMETAKTGDLFSTAKIQNIKT